jgi:hypothetical protein
MPARPGAFVQSKVHFADGAEWYIVKKPMTCFGIEIASGTCELAGVMLPMDPMDVVVHGCSASSSAAGQLRNNIYPLKY